MIRKVFNEDINFLNIFLRKFDNNFEKHFNLTNYINNEIYNVLVYTISDQIVGFILSTTMYDESEIYIIFVDEKSRKKGIATKLINYHISQLSSKSILLEVSSKNEVAINLYKKLNFKIINIRKNYYKDSDAYVMKLEV
ncbi:MAG: GNAT family N-acetyltransferase [Bacilli bacterium]